MKKKKLDINKFINDLIYYGGLYVEVYSGEPDDICDNFDFINGTLPTAEDIFNAINSNSKFKKTLLNRIKDAADDIHDSFVQCRDIEIEIENKEKLFKEAAEAEEKLISADKEKLLKTLSPSQKKLLNKVYGVKL